MLHLYYGRESKDAFQYLLSLFKEGKHTIVVPDQFTHQAEAETIRAFGNTGLMNTEVVSFTRIGHKILKETGGEIRVPLSEDGRRMLLAGILRRKSEALVCFQKASRSPGLHQKLEEMISEFKQYGTSPRALFSAAEDEKTPLSLRRKLTDIASVYEDYEEQIKGRYLDKEDAARFYVSKAKDASFITDRTYWIYGFDPFSPMIEELFDMLLVYSKDVHLSILMDPENGKDRELFRLSESFADRVKERAQFLGIPYDEQEIPEELSRKRTPALVHIEKNLFRSDLPVYPEEAPELTFVKAESPFGEIERAAVGIRKLVRESGYRYNEIAVLANDMSGYGKLAARIFREYDIPVFLDEKKKILSDPAAVFVLSLLDIVSGGTPEDVFRLLKTDLTDIPRKDYEMLENYVARFRIKGSRWKKPFAYGTKEKGIGGLLYGEDGLEKLNSIREHVMNFLSAFETDFKSAKNASEKTRVLYSFLSETAGLPDRIEALRDDRIRRGLLGEAEELRQVWDAIVSVLEQLVELSGDEPLSAEEFKTLVEAGLGSKEIGLIPPAVDQVVIGPARRLATGTLKALFVVGAKEGILPANGEETDLLSQEERSVLLSRDKTFCKDNGWLTEEENLAIYRDLAKPTERLFISTSVSDGTKEEGRESEIYTRLRKMFPKNEEKTGGLSVPDALEGKKAGLPHLAKALNEQTKEDWWKLAYNWYLANEPGLVGPVREGLLYRPGNERLEKENARKLYPVSVSPSRLERYSRCPFAHFILYGLKPEEQRRFEPDARSSGDVYHLALMEYSKCLAHRTREETMPAPEASGTERIPLKESLWMTASEEELSEIAERVFDEVVSGYREGMLLMDEAELYRKKRVREVFLETAKALVRQVRTGSVSDMLLEEAFSRKSGFLPAIPIETDSGTFYLEGRIDRVDYLPDHYVKIIDYKSGNDTFEKEAAETGWRLQLMLYLTAALERKGDSGAETDPNGEETETENGETGNNPLPVSAGETTDRTVKRPAGVFYFHVRDNDIDIGKMDGGLDAEVKEKVESELRKTFAMNGLIVEDGTVIRNIAGEEDPSTVIESLKMKKDGSFTGKSLITETDFGKLIDSVSGTVHALIEDMISGNVSASPKEYKEENACKYCTYRPICGIDLAGRK